MWNLSLKSVTETEDGFFFDFVTAHFDARAQNAVIEGERDFLPMMGALQ